MNRKTKLTLGRQEDEAFVLSTVPSTKEDVKQLEERFHMQLYNELALEGGLCPKRRRIYDDLFDELIRITKVHCEERGQLLETVKNEYQQWIRTYEELYSSGMAYAMRQYIVKMEEKKKIESDIETLEHECQKLRDEIEDESNRFDVLSREVNETKPIDDPEFRILRSNAKFLQSSNQRFIRDLENTLNHMLSSRIFLGEPIDYGTKKTT